MGKIVKQTRAYSHTDRHRLPGERSIQREARVSALAPLLWGQASPAAALRAGHQSKALDAAEILQ